MRGGLALCFVVGACVSPQAFAPRVDRVDPPSGKNGTVVPIAVGGSNFHLPFTNDLDDGTTRAGAVEVSLGDTALAGATWRAEDRIEAAVPPGLTPGLYDVTVRLGAATATLPAGYEVLSDCVPTWLAGPTLGPATPIAAVNTTTDDEADPFVTRDELTIYFARMSDIWSATRTSPTGAFDPPALDPASSPSYDTKISLTSDGLLAYINSSRAPNVGGTDILRGTRATVGDPFTFDNVGVALLNDDGFQWDPHISGDGLRIYYAPEDAAGTVQHIMVAKRASTAEPFGPPAVIAELVGAKDNDPTLTLDERVIVYASDRDGIRKLWYAVRADRDAVFAPPAALPMEMAIDDGPHISADGCSLYFVSGRAGTRDIYVAPVQ